MSWTFEQYQISPNILPSSPYCMAFDGKYVWVAAGTNVYVYAYWGEDGYEERLGQEYYFDTNMLFSALVATVAVGSVVWSMVAHNGTMYLNVSGNQLKACDILTRVITTVPTAPGNITQNSVIVADNKIWIVGAGTDTSDRNSLYYHDLFTGLWSSAIPIPGKKGGTRYLANGLDGNVIVTCGNEHSIAKFNASTGAYVGSYRVNRGPYRLHVNQDKVVYIVSALDTTSVQNGMISTFNQSTNTSTNLASAGGYLYGLGETTDYVWTVGGIALLARTRKSDQDYRYVGGDAPGYTITLPSAGWNPTTTSTGLVTPQFTYEKWNGASFDTITVKPYLFYGTANRVVTVRLNSMIRVNSADVLGTAMISVDQQDYYGEN